MTTALEVPNANQADSDGDGMGNACDTVGGIVELVAVADAPADASGFSSARDYAGPLALLAAGVVVALTAEPAGTPGGAGCGRELLFAPAVDRRAQ